jgi:lipopolysaccharide export system protein LptC
MTLEEARKRARFIRVWRWLCITVAAGAGLLVLATVVIGSIGGDMGFDRDLSAREALKMINPRFTGRANNGAAYTVNADSATRRSRTSEVIDLDLPVFQGELGQTARAPKGVYKENARTLELAGGVVFLDKSGNRFDTATALVDAARDRAVGSGAIQGSGPLGSVRADNYEIQTSSGRVFLRGHVRGVIRESAFRDTSS